VSSLHYKIPTKRVGLVQSRHHLIEILWKIMVSHNDLNLTNIIDGQQINQTKNHYSPQHASIGKKHIGNSCCTQYFYFANNCVATWDIVKTS
jgi:hypothetical protein